MPVRKSLIKAQILEVTGNPQKRCFVEKIDNHYKLKKTLHWSKE
jgi:hypothetical protein